MTYPGTPKFEKADGHLLKITAGVLLWLFMSEGRYRLVWRCAVRGQFSA